MSITLTKVLNLARSEVGYIEKATNSDLYSKTANAGTNNYTKYAYDLDLIGYYNGKKNGYAWCCTFIDWLFYRTGGMKEAKAVTYATTGYGASVKWQWTHYKQAGRVTNTPQVGALVIFKDFSHIGIVESVFASTYTTIEGNTNGTGLTAADRVARHTYSTGLEVVGFCLPNYAEETDIGDISKWHREGAEWCVENGIFVGDGNDYRWEDNITRAEAATIIYRLYKAIREEDE